jgi:hypothetical protein
VTTKGSTALLSPRSALVLVIATIVAFIAGMLAHLSGSPPAAAVLYGGGAFGATLLAANSLIGQ